MYMPTNHRVKGDLVFVKVGLRNTTKASTTPDKDLRSGMKPAAEVKRVHDL